MALASALGRKRVWFWDEPGFQDVTLDLEYLRLIDVIRSAASPLTHAQLIELGMGTPAELKVRLDRLEALGLVQHAGRAGRRGPGFFCEEAVMVVILDRSRASEQYLERYIRLTQGFNESLPVAVHRYGPQEIPDRLHCDRVFRMTEEERADIEATIGRLCRRLREIEERSCRPAAAKEKRQAVRVVLRRTDLEHEGPTFPPLLRMYEDDLSYPKSILHSVANQLTPRQREVADRILAGLTGVEIAAELGISENTVKSTTREIYRRLDVSSKAEMINLLIS